MSAGNTVVQFRRVSYVPPGADAAAFCDLDLEIRRGETLVLLGASGCGKATTLRLIAGLERVDVGEIRVDGRDVIGVRPGAAGSAWFFSSTPSSRT